MVTALTQHKRWVECADARHATDDPPAGPGDEVVTLCDVTLPIVQPTPGIPAPECPGCDRRWRQLDGIELREDHSPWHQCPDSNKFTTSAPLNESALRSSDRDNQLTDHWRDAGRIALI